MTFAIILACVWAVHMVGGRVTDGIAAANRQPIPSHEKWKARHGSKPPKGRTGFGRYLSQAADQAMTKVGEYSRQKHDRKMAWLAENEGRKSDKHVGRKRRRLERRDRVAERFTNGRAAAGRGVKRAATVTGAGVAAGWQRTKDATPAARRAEDEAWNQNAVRDVNDQLADNNRSEDTEPAEDWPDTDPDSAAQPEQPVEPETEAPASNVTPISRTAGNRSNPMSSAIQGDTTTIEGARACVNATIAYADEIGGRFEDMSAQAAQLHQSVETTVGQLDGALGGMTQAGVGGDLVAAMQQALDQLGSAAQQLEQVEQIANQVGDAAGGLRQSAQQASAALVKHESIAEHVQATEGVARSTAWYGARQHASV